MSADIAKRPVTEGIMMPLKVTLWRVVGQEDTPTSGGHCQFYVLTDGPDQPPDPSKAIAALSSNRSTLYDISYIKNIGSSSIPNTKEIHPDLNKSQGCYNQTSCPMSSQDTQSVANMLLWHGTLCNKFFPPTAKPESNEIAKQLKEVSKLAGELVWNYENNRYGADSYDFNYDDFFTRCFDVLCKMELHKGKSGEYVASVEESLDYEEIPDSGAF